MPSQRRDSLPQGQLEAARNALDAAAQLKDPGRAGRLERRVVDAADQAMDSGDAFKTLLEGVNTLLHTLPSLVRALDAVAQIHPFLSVAVGAFKVVIELEVIRHDNDKKVNLLFLEMRNMMTALLQLDSVRTNHVGRDGLTISMRLEDLVAKTAKDIKDCANACDAYARKRLLVKVLKSHGWDEKLKEYIQLFNDRKAEFTFAISIHTGIGVDRANDKLDTLMSKADLILEFFQKTIPREQDTLAKVVRREGGAEVVLVRADVLQKLLVAEKQLELAALPSSNVASQGIGAALYPQAQIRSGPGIYYFSRAAENQRAEGRPPHLQRRGSYRPPPDDYYYDRGPGHRPPPTSHGNAYPTPYGPDSESGSIRRRERSRPHGASPARPHEYEPVVDEWAPQPSQMDVGRLMQDLADDPETAVRKNYVWFERKFALQQRNIIREMTRVVVYEGDRVINTVLEGPHEKILDGDIYRVWKDMRWRGLVKARHLVLALYDHYAQQIDIQRYTVTTRRGIVQPAFSERDLWTLDFLKLTQLHSLTEVFDMDASGFVTIQEVNDFTTRRPEGWSLPHWLAYWTVGWQASMTSYKHKIDALLARMQAFPSSVRARGPLVNDYLATVEPLVREMTSSFRQDLSSLPLLDHFQGYIEQEEARIREGLETVKYDLDALDTLALINGPWGIERNLFIILYLLLRRHYDVMRAAHKVIIHPAELPDAAAVITLVMDAVRYRVEHLKSVFYQRRLDPHRELEDYACGMFQWPPTRISYGYPMSVSPDAPGFDGIAEEFEVDDVDDKPPEVVLKYPPHFEEFYPESEDGFEGSDLSNPSENIKPLLGHWVVVRLQDTGSTIYRDISVFDFHPSPTDSNKAIAIPLLERPWLCTRVTLTGVFVGTNEDGRTMYDIVDTSNATFIPDVSCKLALDDDGTTLRGESELGPFGSPVHLVLKKNVSPETMMFYPAPAELRKNRPATLWRFAISVVLYDVRRRLFSWAYIKERRDRKRLLTSLLYARSRNGTLHPDDQEDEWRLLDFTTPADRHFYEYALVEPERFPWLLPWCESCGKLLRSSQPQDQGQVCERCRPRRYPIPLNPPRLRRKALRKGQCGTGCTIA
ncbi:hypothetical protein OH77DRAFT_1503798 [Trametes cingulata]|nr:hypothetical protein OH77DRAFT_1503798 [Trametes cingulata]